MPGLYDKLAGALKEVGPGMDLPMTTFWEKDAADGAAATATAEHSIFEFDGKTSILAALGLVYTKSDLFYVPDAALTANDNDFATLTVAIRDGAGGAATNVAQINTKTSASGGTGNWVAFVPVPVNLLSVIGPGNPAVLATVPAAGSVLTVAITKSGAGVAVPAGKLMSRQFAVGAGLGL